MPANHILVPDSQDVLEEESESQIVQLINFAGEWNKYWQSSAANGNLQQPVNGSNNPGSSDGNGGNFSLNDLIRLNLLKSTTTNILTRMETSRTTTR